jgi:hypothetical protein
MDIILFIFSLLLSLLFKNYKYITFILIARSVIILLLHYIYFVIYPDTNGLSPAYNDEILFITEASIKNFQFSLFDYLFQVETASAYINFLRIFNESVFDLALFAKMVNNVFFIILLVYSVKFLKFFNIQKKYQILLLLLLTLSPSFIFFNSLVLRDTIIASVLTMSIYYLISARYVLFFLNSFLLMFLRKHLLLSIYLAMVFTFKRLSLKCTFLIALAFLTLAGILNIPFFTSSFNSLLIYFYEFWINIVGLNFLIADSGLFIVSPARVFIQRIIALDTFIPQIYLFYLLIKYKNIITVHKLTYLYIIINLIYLYFYWLNGNSAARVTILPFIPIVYIQIFYYLNMLNRNKYKHRITKYE